MRLASGLLLLAAIVLLLERAEGPIGRIAGGPPFWPLSLVLALVTGAIARKRRIVLPAAIVFFLAPDPAVNLPDRRPHDLRVMTYNIAHRDGGLRALAADIRREDPDLLFLQEAGPWDVSGVDDYRQWLPEYQSAVYDHVVILSKSALTGICRMDGPMRARNGQGWDGIVAQTKLRGRVIRVATLHHVPWSRGESPWQNANEIVRFEKEIAAALGSGPSIVGGDFNCQRAGPLAQGRRDAWADGGLGYGPTLPVHRADHLLASGLEAIRTRTGGSASDHRYLVADYLFPG